jgi:hypothetical protein
MLGTMRRDLLLSVLLLAAASAACESGDGPGPTAPSTNIVSVSITPPTDFLKLKAQERLVLNAQLTTGVTQQVTAGWSSDNNAVATVDSGGLVTAVGIGTVNITADYQGRKATRNIRVLPDYHGLWGGDFFVTSCTGPSAICGTIRGPSFPATLEIVQTVSVVSAKWTLQGDATGNVTGTIGTDGHLSLDGTFFLGPISMDIATWDSLTNDNVAMTGGFTLDWSGAPGASAVTVVELRNFRRR